MNIILGATGQIGAMIVENLLSKGESGLENKISLSMGFKEYLESIYKIFEKIFCLSIRWK